MNTQKKLTLQDSMKRLKEMTLLDRFLFNETMNIPEAHAAALQIILGQENLALLDSAQAEKEVQTLPWLRAIRLDVYALDRNGTVYDTEMQAQQKTDLRRRSRFYQGMIDSTLLIRGTVNFNDLKDICIIMITPFDLFGKEKYCYTFVPSCKEDKEIELDDGAVRIFLNTRGKNDADITSELRDFLHYVECTDDEFVANCKSERIKLIHACVNRIKSSEEAGVRYMQRWEERIYDRQEGKEEGRSEGEVIGTERATLSAIRKMMTKKHMTAEEAFDLLDVPKENREKYLSQLTDRS